MDNRDSSQNAAYEKPAVKDYGTLQELTASGGSKVQDVPIGTPVGDGVGSTP